MSERASFGSDLARGTGRVFSQAAALVIGLILMVVGVALGVSLVMLPVGIPVGLAGLLLFLWGILHRPRGEQTPAPPAPRP